MTCLVVLQTSERLRLQLQDLHLQVSLQAAQLNGTTAELIEDDKLSAIDLLHGVMLPSGNDSALTLAQNFGSFLYFEAKEEE